jgi:predicted amidohydrolase YtcJ
MSPNQSAELIVRAEHSAGVLAPGFDADFVVLDTDVVLAVAPAELAALDVLRAPSSAAGPFTAAA